MRSCTLVYISGRSRQGRGESIRPLFCALRPHPPQTREPVERLPSRRRPLVDCICLVYAEPHISIKEIKCPHLFLRWVIVSCFGENRFLSRGWMSASDPLREKTCGLGIG